ncbi:tyrosine-type recombinase/integrase [Rhizobium sp. YIM 134829]|uniref:tyrosine-type recombinase/integrase n=1 Tax=Rhizobium sp. YIM 134829 TaxID=3390453 RepID=UPI0039783148
MPKSEQQPVKLTKRAVDAIKPNGTDFYVFDSELRGFGVRVRKGGGMSYIVQYRTGAGRAGSVKRVTIAQLGKVTPEQAREEGKRILASVVKGEDPAQEKAAARTAMTFGALASAYLDNVAAKKKPTTHDLYRHLLKTYALDTLSKRPAASITSLDIAPIHLKLKAKATTGNRLLAVIGAMFSWAMDAKLLPKMENPASGIEKFKEAKRERFLTSAELQRLGEAITEAETAGIPWEPDPEKNTKHAPKAENRRVKIDATVAAALRLYVLTGARRNEILGLTWDMVDLERGLLFLPDSKTGQKTIILNGPAQLILSELPRVDRYVVPGRPRKRADGTWESRPRADLKRPWAAVRRHAGLMADADNPRFRVRLHDLRHTFASVGAGSNMGLPIVGKLLGHKQSRTTERYAHLEADPVRKASEAIGARIMDAMGGNGSSRDNVVPLEKSRK